MDYKKNDIITIKIEDMSHEGLGIGKLEGYTVFVKDAVVGDLAKVRLTKTKKTYAFARLEEIVEASADRVEPVCPIARICGGCQMMQVAYDKQLQLKDSIVAANLVKIGGFDKSFIHSIREPIIGMEDPFRYRNKAQIPVGYDNDGNLVAGFYGARSHRIVPTNDCRICSKKSMEIAQSLLSFMKEKKIAAYDEKSGKGLIRHILVREGKATGETMVCIVVNGDELPYQKELLENLLLVDESIASIVMNINTRRDNVIMGYETKVLWGKEAITDSINLSTGDTISFNISANSFYQVNHDQMERLYSRALEYAALTGKENVWDLYCGIGTISLSMARHAGRVYGVEVVPSAIENAKINAGLNNLNNTEFFLGQAEVVLPDFYKKNAGDNAMLHPDVIMVDPPRKGCDISCLDTMLAMEPERIVYVSCDSATLARDLKYLCQEKYKLKKYTVVDQFGHTMHTETCALLEKTSINKTE